MLQESPFTTYSHAILASYEAASILRRVVLSIWCGAKHPVGLSDLAELDADHFDIAQKIIAHVHQVGRHDSDFLKFVDDVRSFTNWEIAERTEREVDLEIDFLESSYHTG